MGVNCVTADVGKVMHCACYESSPACLSRGGLENSQREWTTSAYVQRVSKIIHRLLLLAIM